MGGHVLSYFREAFMSYPRPVRRLMWWWTIPLVVLLVFIVLDCWPDLSMKTRTRIGSLSSYVPFVMLAVAIAAYGFGLARLRRAFKAAGGSLCTNCAHSVSGLGDQGHCPECGHWFNIEVDRIAWRASKIELDRPK